MTLLFYFYGPHLKVRKSKKKHKHLNFAYMYFYVPQYLENSSETEFC